VLRLLPYFFNKIVECQTQLERVCQYIILFSNTDRQSPPPRLANDGKPVASPDRVRACLFRSFFHKQ
jgi:hypothetical protein